MDTGRQSSSELEVTRSPIHSAPSVSPTRGSTRGRRKRRAGGFIARTGPPPFKRVKSDFNSAYVNLLNQDIQDASSGLIHSEERPELEHTQIGAVVWSAAEKKVFFAALSRIGKDDVVGISARIGTKSELEVRQYLVFLDAAKRRPHGDEGKRASLRPVDIPAAVEIGAECTAMLEVAADGLSLRQEDYEEEVEKERWGSRWLITAPLAQILENSLQSQIEDKQLRDEEEDREEEPLLKEDEEQDERNRSLEELPFLQLFPIPNWLQLSDCIFMNSTVSDGNWHAVSEEYEPPAIQATALADFYGLVFSVTRRLLLATMYMAESRVRTRSLNDMQRRRRTRIRVEDVAAAVASLGMKQNSREFWARCARRLQLDIVDDKTGEDDLTDQENEDTDTERSEDMDIDGQQNTVESRSGSIEDTAQEAEESEEEGDYEIMSYNEVETALGYPAVVNTCRRPSSPESHASTTPERISSASEDERNKGEHEEEHGAERMEEENDEYERDIEMENPSHGLDDSLNPDAIKRDIEEAMIFLAPIGHTGMDVVPTRQAMKSQIRAEHRLERDAERLDLKASTDAETKLWAVLRGDSDSKTKGHKSRSRQD
ncbi:hypothetical protein E0Z10_g7765 [Xylaria hypoxylon]|uniref:Myb-like domain-containing protein n=1 Tax=Xylaria hypoxylon TaxID=37992 RepID=A0A4Z0YU65_9PEZI|nr:hypothetical protein E0Z10_g7765 [Xylaria hypoxylon]